MIDTTEGKKTRESRRWKDKKKMDTNIRRKRRKGRKDLKNKTKVGSGDRKMKEKEKKKECKSAMNNEKVSQEGSLNEDCSQGYQPSDTIQGRKRNVLE